MADNEHAGKVALITGGGRGFGKAFGAALTALGAHVVLADVDGDAARAVATELTEKGGNATGVACDVTDEARVNEVVADIVAAHGGLDILVNNAGLHSAAYNKPSAELGVERLRRLFEVNVMGVVICTLAVKEAMHGRFGASIVNLSSSASYPNRTAYGVSKLAVRGMTAQFAHELGSEGIRVNGIAPGLIFTDTLRAELGESEVKRVMSGQVLPQEGAEADIVEALLYLVSNRASFITGETLRVSGGFTLSV